MLDPGCWTLNPARRAQVLQLWEALWSRHLGPHLHLYLAAAILILHRRTIMEARPWAPPAPAAACA